MISIFTTEKELHMPTQIYSQGVQRSPLEKGGMTSATTDMMLRKEQWIEVGAMQIDNGNDYGIIQIAALEIGPPLPEAKERIKEKALIVDRYREICKKVVTEGNIDKEYTIKDDILCWKDRVYISEGV